MNPNDLPKRWRQRAAELRDLGLESQARCFEACADELSADWVTWWTEPLMIAEAEAESGYSRSQIGRLVKDGTIANMGKDGAPRVRRCDLPRKAQAPERSGNGGMDLADRVLAGRDS